jgi:aspartate/methionine/tyrosine aminotransferase
MVSEYVERRDALVSALSTIEGVRPFTPRGAFYVWAELDPAIYERLGVADAADLSDKLAAIGIGSAPGSRVRHDVRRRDPLRLQLRDADGEGGRRGAEEGAERSRRAARESVGVTNELRVVLGEYDTGWH